MPKRIGWIRQFHKPAAPDLAPLLIFPHAGTGASTYRVFSKALSAHFDVRLVQYPGRQDRAAEPFADNLAELAAGALAEWDDTRPLTVFGHSMGAIVGFEFVRRAEAAGLNVVAFGASGAVAPALVADMPRHPTEDEELLDHLAALDGTGADVLGNRDVMRLTLPALRADYAAFDRYSCAPDVVVQTRIHVLGGSDDEHVGRRHLHAWAQHSAREISVTMFEGGHFYLDQHVEAITELLAAEVVSAR